MKFNLGIECETYIVRRDPSAHNGIAPNDPRDTIAKAAYDASLTLLNLELLNDIVSSMNKLGWEVHSFDHEDANGQFEFDFAYADVHDHGRPLRRLAHDDEGAGPEAWL